MGRCSLGHERGRSLIRAFRTSTNWSSTSTCMYTTNTTDMHTDPVIQRESLTPTSTGMGGFPR